MNAKKLLSSVFLFAGLISFALLAGYSYSTSVVKGDLVRPSPSGGEPILTSAKDRPTSSAALQQATTLSREHTHRFRLNPHAGSSGDKQINLPLRNTVSEASGLNAASEPNKFALDFAPISGAPNSYVTFGNPSKLGLATFSIEVWFQRQGPGIKTDVSASEGVTAIPLVTKGRGECDNCNKDMNYFLGIRNTDNVLLADFEEGAGAAVPGRNHPITGVTPIENDTWYHAAATYNGTKWQLFLNGVLERELTVGQPPRWDSLQHAAIGSALTSTGVPQGYFDGVIDEVRIWNYARTGEQIQASMNLEITVEPGLVGRWGLNEGTGSAVADSTGNPVAGTVVNTNWSWTEGAPFNNTVNRPPNAPALNGPADGATLASTSATLDVTASDPDNDGLTVTYYGKAVTSVVPAQPDFTIVALPDTQFYVSNVNGGRPEIFNSQTQWIVNNRLGKNIVFVTQLGDCVQNGDNGGNPVEWDRSWAAMSKLEDPIPTMLAEGIPYGIAVGNHDQSPVGDPNGTTALYNQYFGINHFTGRSYYGGNYGVNNDNHFELFSAGGMDFIVVHLEYDPAANPAVLSWADMLLKTYSGRRAIIVSHYIINSGGDINSGINASFSAQGKALYNAVKGNPNLFLMLSGHVSPPEGQRKDVVNGNTVYSLMSDYQSRTNGGNGWLRVMEFSPANNEIRVKTYSPWLNQFETDADSQFTLSYNMQNATSSGFTAIATNSGISSGSSVTTTWSNLSPNTEYEWYVTVNDGTNQSTGPIWRFTTGPAANQPPAVSRPGNQTNSEGENVSLQVQANDPDGDNISYSAAGLPDGLSIDAQTGVISGTLSFISAGNYDVAVTVSDNKDGSANTNFTWAVNDTNRAPTVLNPGNQSGTEGSSANLQISATDPDSDPLNYSATGLPAGLTINNGTGLISGLLNSSAGSYTVVVTVSDNQGGTSSASFGFTVTASCPTLTLAPNTLQDGNVGASYQQTITAGGGKAPYNFALTSGALPLTLTLSTTGVVSGIPKNGTQQKIYNFAVTVEDAQGCKASRAYALSISK